MKKNYYLPFVLALAISFIGFNGYSQSSRSTINIDFGSASQKSPEPEWNNITDPTAGAVANLTNDQGVQTGISIAITSPFNAMNNVTATADDTLGIHPMAATDNFYGNTNAFGGKTIPTVVLTISNLDVTKAYSFAFFGNRASVSENRETLYTVEGLTNPDPVGLNVSSNTSKMVRVSNVMPKEDGTITVVIEAGPNNVNGTGFYHISAMKISYSNTVAGISPDISAGRINVYPNPAVGTVSISTGSESRVESVQLLSLSGVKVLEKSAVNGSIESLDVSGLAQGLYYMQVQTNKGRFHSKLVVNK
ncbi:T9SS type A sorting domain-containing protein [Rufibacter roseus]|uniref:T9SS type A sorting domain-containing protein n=1 Tax=Rufibacter roseus TaxID=1567108 RepID=A0ABW2DMT5_9BACT|nr:T9SS type A sorting domain-containing protein [Rufibacter roseus]